MRACLWAALLSLSISPPATFAQEADSSASPLVVHYQASGEGFWLDGNTERLIVGGRGVFTLFPQASHQLVLRPSYFFGRVTGRITDREGRVEGLAYLFADGYRGTPWYGFALGIYTHSKLRQVDTRWHGGVGIGTHLIRLSDRRLAFSFAVLGEETTFASGTVRRPARASFRAEGQLAFAENRFRFTAETLVKPAFRDASDIIWLTLITFDIALTPRLAARLALDNTYESVVPVGLASNDVRLTFGLSIQR